MTVVQAKASEEDVDGRTDDSSCDDADAVCLTRLKLRRAETTTTYDADAEDDA